ncbi:MAG: fucose isomerase [Bacteroidetes bacterium GWD2_45_23]|nr:MAG: fucose isomerase [Bacteroidetes bacterium GWC2_46_850]OFX86741.1 MAG: fucose isomerase [Bacteroidetes bacterium GWD2_45_23]HAR37596.1 L-fucose mutarotase [Porphyromonadaceae bacterium]HBB01972.1 L-fucose mutarotase [Porphyromonadaceae bacterium]HCC19513.1 L-fucose mutarotase [Porphyromonadaceae bacterium]
MLKKIPKTISPQLLKTLMEMGHGDEIVIADGNFPCHTISQNVIRADGLSGTEILKAIMELFPLDTYSDQQVFLMEVVSGDSYKPEIWNNYMEILQSSGETFTIGYIERFAFYERAKKSYAVIATGEEALYANIILKKGVVK